jgi:hypothetical protein
VSWPLFSWWDTGHCPIRLVEISKDTKVRINTVLYSGLATARESAASP